MAKLLTMTQQERDRVPILKEMSRCRMTAAEAARHLHISKRQVYRLVTRYRNQGDAGLIHKLRGRVSNRGYPKGLRNRVIQLYWKQYRDYGATLFAEVLASDHKISVDHETIRRWLMASGGSNVQRKKRPHRRRRERRSAIGELLQFDGSTHDWLEGRGPACCLLHAIDDASGRIFLRFVPSENTADVLRTLRAYCEHYGIPKSLYTDHGSVFFADNKLTDVGRAMNDLGVEMIFANSPQAKGRVERGNRTHQDRLIKALRRKGIATIADANHYLSQVYLQQHNERFATINDLPDIHRPLDGLNLDNIFCFQTVRHIRRDYTITLGGTYVQLLKGVVPLPPPEHAVTVRRHLDDSLHIFHREDELTFRILDSKPQPLPKNHHQPAASHPWRHLHPIGKAKRRSQKPPSPMR